MEILYLAVAFPGAVRVLRAASPQAFFLLGSQAQLVRPFLQVIARILADSPPRPDHAPLGPELLAPVLGLLAGMVEPLKDIVEVPERHLALGRQAVELVGAARTLPSLRQLAARVALSPSHLGAVLARACGCSYPTLLARERVRRARELLLDDDLPLREIARRVGVSGVPALSRIFRRITAGEASGRVPGPAAVFRSAASAIRSALSASITGHGGGHD